MPGREVESAGQVFEESKLGSVCLAGPVNARWNRVFLYARDHSLGLSGGVCCVMVQQAPAAQAQPL